MDEVSQWQDNNQLPRELVLVVQTGREEHITGSVGEAGPESVLRSEQRDRGEIVAESIGIVGQQIPARELRMRADEKIW